MKRRYFIEMDGTIAKWEYVPFERLFEQGYFKNLKTGEIFTKDFDSDYKKRVFLTKCRYSKKIKSLGCVKVWG